MELVKYDEFEFRDIANIVDLPELLKKIKQIDALKIALESCDRFRENAIRYARLEAAALIRIGELGGIGHLKGLKKKVADWLYGLSEAEREKHIAKCAEGLTIDQVWKRDVYSDEKISQGISIIYDMRDDLIEDVKTDGIISIQRFSEEARKMLPGKMAEDAIDGLRGALRKAGAVGIGDDFGTYVMPTKEKSESVKEAILMRWESAMDDFENLREIAKGAEVKLNYKDFGVDIYAADRRSESYKLHFLVALDRLGLIENRDEMWMEFTKSTVYAEIKSVGEIFGKYDVEAAEIVLENYKKRREKENIA